MAVNIEQINAQFLSDLNLLQEDFVKRIEQGLKGGLTLAELDIDFFDKLSALGFEDKFNQYFDGYDEIIKQVHADAVKRGLSGVVGATAIDLDILANNEALFVLDKAKLYTQQFKTSVIRSVIGGETIGEILPTLRNIPLIDPQLTIGIDTGISRFHATTTAKVFEGSPNQKFRLEHPVDAKTRASCRAASLNQKKEGYTKAEIDAGAFTKLALENMTQFEHSPSEIKFVKENGYTFIVRGGYNCRGLFKPKGIATIKL